MSSEKFKSLIVDPNILDEGIDVSDLRTRTDTNPLLLGNLEPGLRYDPTLQSTYSDLLQYYAGGLPLLPEPGKVVPPATGTPGTGDGGGGAGGGGQVTVPGVSDSTTTPTFPPTSAPFVEIAPNVLSAKDPITGQPVPGNIVDPRTGDIFAPGDYSDVAGTLADPREKIDVFSTTPVSPSGQPIDPTGMLPQTSPFMVTGALGVDPREKQDFVTQEDVDNPEGLLEKLGLKGFNAKEAAVKAAINAAVGGPITFVIDALKNILPPQDPRQTALNEFYNLDDIGRVAKGELMAGYNPVSGGFLNTITGGRLGEPTKFGLEEAYNTRIANVRETLTRQYGFTKEELDQIEAGNITPKILATGFSDKLGRTTTNIQKLADLAAGKKAEGLALRGPTSLVTGDIDKDPTGDASIAETLAARDRLGFIDDIGVEGEDADRFIDNIGGGIDQGAVDLGTMDTTSRPNPFADIDTGVGEFAITPTAPRDTVLGKEGIDRINDYLDNQAFEEQFGTAPITGGLPSITEDQLRSQLDQSGEQIGTLEDLEEMEDLYATSPNIMRDFEFDQVDDPPTGTDRPGGDRRDDSPAPSPPTGTGGPPSVISRPTPTFTPKGGGADRDPAPAPKPTPTPRAPDFVTGGGGGGGGGGGRWCCSQMVHHGLWNQSYQFSRLTVWSSKQPNWWRSGYNVWGKVIAKYLLNKKGFWTEVMQSFYDNHVRKQKRTLKSTIADIIIYPGSFICGLIWKKIPTKARLAKKEELK